ncbi:hypothetical protein [Thermopirellula anaerolimosa]
MSILSRLSPFETPTWFEPQLRQRVEKWNASLAEAQALEQKLYSLQQEVKSSFSAAKAASLQKTAMAFLEAANRILAEHREVADAINAARKTAIQQEKDTLDFVIAETAAKLAHVLEIPVPEEKTAAHAALKMAAELSPAVARQRHTVDKLRETAGHATGWTLVRSYVAADLAKAAKELMPVCSVSFTR